MQMTGWIWASAAILCGAGGCSRSGLEVDASLSGGGMSQGVSTSAASTSAATAGGGGSPCIPVADDEACTDDLCEEGVTVHVAKADGEPCDDGDGCTQTDRCQSGACAGSDPLICAGDTVCVEGACVGPVCTGLLGFPGPPLLTLDPGSHPSAPFVAMSDLDGDGTLDLVITRPQFNHVSVLLGLGNGTFNPSVDTDLGASVRDVVIADFNQDGAPDLAADSGVGVTVLLNQGGGTFVVAGAFPVDPIDGLVSADFDGDGTQDVAGVVFSKGEVDVLLNQGDGNFAPFVGYAAGPSPTSIATADLDGDGMPDLAVATNQSDEVRVLLNQSDGTFAPMVAYPAGSQSGFVVAADLDGDGRPDLAVGSLLTVSVLLNQGDGTFAGAVDYPVDYYARAVVAEDLNGDGMLDLAVAAGDVSVLQNLGAGVFAPAVSYPVGPAFNGVTAGDLNGDGAIDLAAALLGSESSEYGVRELFNQGDGTFLTPLRSATDYRPTSAQTADLDGDGDADLVVAEVEFDWLTRTGTASVGVMLNEGDGHFSTPIQYSQHELEGAPSEAPFALGDLDADGLPDLIVGRWEVGSVGVFFNQGNGLFSAPTDYQAAATATDSITTGDMNGDGPLDIVLTEYPNQVRVLLNQGDGAFISAPPLAVPSPRATALSDFNGDGNADLVVLGGGYKLNVLLGHGDGTFALPVEYTLEFGPVSVAAADLDADGKPDFAVAGTQGMIAYFGLGDGTFAPQLIYYSGQHGESIVIADLNQDGMLDLAMSSYYEQRALVFLNQGSRVFAAPLDYPAGTPNAMVSADFDGDGLRDLAVTHGDDDYAEAGAVLVLRNTCLP